MSLDGWSTVEEGPRSSFREMRNWVAREWAKLTPFERRLWLQGAPAMAFTVVMLAFTLLGAPVGGWFLAAAAATQTAWSLALTCFDSWQRWKRVVRTPAGGSDSAP